MHFAQLLELAKQQSSKQQLELHKKEQLRLAAERAAQAEADARAAAERKAVDERRREREERDRRRREDEERKARELPKTRNLVALKQERMKRGMDPDGKDDIKPRVPPASKLRKPLKDGGPPTREEKAARRRAALFKREDSDEPEESGGMALARALGGPSSSRAHFPSKALPLKPLSSTSSISTNGSPRPMASTSTSGRASKNPRRPSSAPATVGGSARDRLKAGFNPKTLIKLNENKRDLRTIEEVEMDMRRGKANAKPESNARLPPHSIPPNHERPPPPRRGTDIPAQTMRKPSSSKKRDEPDSEPETSSDDEDEDDHRKHKRPRKGKHSGEYSQLTDTMRSEIWSLMGRNRQRDLGRDNFDSDDSDMEVTGQHIWEEEAKADRLAKKEDELEQERLRKHAEEKRLRLARKTR